MWPWIIGSAIVGGLAWLLVPRKAQAATSGAVANVAKTGITSTAKSLVPISKTMPPSDPFKDSVVVTTPDGTAWIVAPSYVGPVGINEAAALAKQAGGELPSPALVDAIWRAADLKLLPMPRNNLISQEVFDDQKRRIQEQIAGRPFSLLAGTFKDVVQVNGHPEIYGWHVEDGKSVAGVPLNKPSTPGPGKVIQPQSGKRHDSPGAIGFVDYSQGWRAVKRA